MRGKRGRSLFPQSGSLQATACRGKKAPSPFPLLFVTGLCLAALAQDAPPAPPTDDGAAIDPMGPNSACYVCHITFLREELAKVHLKVEVTCIKCHGLSAGHANDENIGETKPDITYPRERVNTACRECHPSHDVPPEDIIARWQERERTDSPPVCTDCHGTHRLDSPSEPEQGDA